MRGMKLEDSTGAPDFYLEQWLYVAPHNCLNSQISSKKRGLYLTPLHPLPAVILRGLLPVSIQSRPRVLSWKILLMKCEVTVTNLLYCIYCSTIGSVSTVTLYE